MRIAVIVPCRDRLISLARCLRSIALAIDELAGHNALSFDLRILVIDDHSDHGFAAALARDFPWVEVVAVAGQGPGAARNTGLKHADADLYLLTDSDCIVSQDWFLRALEWYGERKGPMAQGTPWLYQKIQNPDLGACEENLYRHMFARYLDNDKTSMIDPRCMMVARDYFDLFPRDIFATWILDASYEDRAVIGGLIENGLRVDWFPAASVYHEDPPDIEALWRQKYRHGSGRVYSWADPPAYEFLLSRYFLAPIAAGNDRNYVISAHLAFLLGYRDAYRRKNLHEADWWIGFQKALGAAMPEAPSWIRKVEGTVSTRETVKTGWPRLRAFRTKIQVMYGNAMRASRP